jgi:hypothetical protein
VRAVCTAIDVPSRAIHEGASAVDFCCASPKTLISPISFCPITSPAPGSRMLHGCRARARARTSHEPRTRACSVEPHVTRDTRRADDDGVLSRPIDTLDASERARRAAGAPAPPAEPEYPRLPCVRAHGVAIPTRRESCIDNSNVNIELGGLAGRSCAAHYATPTPAPSCPRACRPSCDGLAWSSSQYLAARKRIGHGSMDPASAVSRDMCSAARSRCYRGPLARG